MSVASRPAAGCRRQKAAKAGAAAPDQVWIEWWLIRSLKLSPGVLVSCTNWTPLPVPLWAMAM